jgi:flagellar basal body-associated protein FliL
MAQKRKTKKNKLRTLLLFVLTPLVVWLLAFVIWFYWNSITPLFRQAENPAKASPKPVRRDAPEKAAKERISDEERKKLDEILKKQTR